MLQKLRAAYVAVRLDGAGLMLVVLGLAVLAAAGVVVLRPVIGLTWALVAAGLVLLLAGALLLWLPRRRSATTPARQTGHTPAHEAARTPDDLAGQAKRWAAEHPVETLVIGAAVGGLLVASPRARRIVRGGLGAAAAADRLRDRPGGDQSSR